MLDFNKWFILLLSDNACLNSLSHQWLHSLKAHQLQPLVKPLRAQKLAQNFYQKLEEAGSRKIATYCGKSSPTH